MSKQNETKNQDNKPDTHESIFNAVGHLTDQLQAMEKFVARRFDELSMEINATSQQVDMAEEGITRRFAEILEVIHAISYSGDGKTPANAGVELDAVVDMTEQAANRILDAAGRISIQLNDTVDWANEAVREKAFERIHKDIQEVFMACSFQDITGQRIRKTLDNLKEIENRLNTALDKIGIVVEIEKNPNLQQSEIADQSDIDALFADGRKG
jgi:chemotaxis protein CheZ